MGVCPQFDTLWAALSACEHLQLFAAIKGVQRNDIPLEVTRRIEEVRLTDAADRMAGTYSGGMRRRLSVAIALIGKSVSIEPASEF
jgi:ABC-type multidrug transport system ATPase subunit